MSRFKIKYKYRNDRDIKIKNWPIEIRNVDLPPEYLKSIIGVYYYTKTIDDKTIYYCKTESKTDLRDYKWEGRYWHIIRLFQKNQESVS